MAWVSNFCFWFSIRLGCIIIAVFCLVQATVFLGLVLSSDQEFVSNKLHSWFTILNFDGEILRHIADNSSIIISVSATFYSFLAASSLLMLIGCYQINLYLVYPFMILYLLYILKLLSLLPLFILYVKIKGNGLGDLILYSNLGGFLLLFYFYTWICVVSFVQIIKELQGRLSAKLKVAQNVNKIVKPNKRRRRYNTKLFHSPNNFRY